MNRNYGEKKTFEEAKSLVQQFTAILSSLPILINQAFFQKPIYFSKKP